METQPLLGTKNRKQKVYGGALVGLVFLVVMGVIAWSSWIPATTGNVKLALTQRQFEMDPPTKGFQTFANGPVPVEFHIATEPTFAIRSEVYKLPNDPPILIEVTSDAGVLKVNVTSDKNFQVHDNQRVKVFIDLPPQKLDTLFDIEVGSIDWKGKASFTDLVGKIDVGSAKFETIEANSIDLNTHVGSIKIQEAATDIYHSKLSTGSIDATIKDYSEAVIRASVGSITGTFEPKLYSNTTLGSSTGSIHARVIHYGGNFDLNTSTGSLRVSGADIHYKERRKFPAGHSVKGIRGNDGPLSNHFDASTSVGSINIVFE
jgi:hypothetical protein